MVTRRVIQTGSTQQATGPTLGGRTVDAAAARYTDRNRRTVRSRDLVEAVGRLDVMTDPRAATELMEWIREEYEERHGGDLVGVFGKCFLGEPYLDHRLDLSGGFILEHFTRAEAPPMPFGAARPLARNGAYEFIEVYSDGSVVPVRADGRPVI